MTQILCVIDAKHIEWLPGWITALGDATQHARATQGLGTLSCVQLCGVSPRPRHGKIAFPEASYSYVRD